MASTTKLELQQRLLATAKELDAARIRIAELEGDVTALKAMYGRAAQAVVASDCARGEALMELRNKQVIKPAYVPKPPSEDQLAFRALMARCKELCASGVKARIVGRELIVD